LVSTLLLLLTRNLLANIWIFTKSFQCLSRIVPGSPPCRLSMTHTGLLYYTIDQLISWRKHAVQLDHDVQRRVRALFSRRGCRAGKKKHHVVLSDVDRGCIPVISAARQVIPTSSSSQLTGQHNTDRQPPSTAPSPTLRSSLSVDGSMVPASGRQHLPAIVRRQRCLSPVSSVDFNAARSSVTFGCLNVRSVLSKFDDIVELCRDHLVDLLCLTETWHDTDSVVLGRLRSA